MAVLCIYYVAPLSSLVQVLQQRDSSSIYWPLCLTNLINAVLWTVYGMVRGICTLIVLLVISVAALGGLGQGAASATKLLARCVGACNGSMLPVWHGACSSAPPSIRK